MTAPAQLSRYGQVISRKNIDHHPPCPCASCEDGVRIPRARMTHFCKLLQMPIANGNEHCDVFVAKEIEE